MPRTCDFFDGPRDATTIRQQASPHSPGKTSQFKSLLSSCRLTTVRYYRRWHSLLDTGYSARRTGQNRTKLNITLVVRFSNSVRRPSCVRSLVVLTLGVGLHSLAVKHYERVLEIAERRTRTNSDVGPTSYQYLEWTVTLAPAGCWII